MPRESGAFGPGGNFAPPKRLMLSRVNRSVDYFTSLFSLDSWVSRLGVVVLVFGSVFLIWAVVYQQVKDEEVLRIRNQAVLLDKTLEQQIGQYEAILMHLQSYLLRAPKRERIAQFHNYLQTLDLRLRYPAVQGIGIAEAVQDGHRGFGALVKAIEPSDDPHNRRTIGFDLYAEPTRRDAIDRSIKVRRPVTSGAVALWPSAPVEERPSGFLIVIPLYESDTSQTPFAFTYAAINAGAIFDGLMRSRGVLGDTEFEKLKVESPAGTGAYSTIYEQGPSQNPGDPYVTEVVHDAARWRIHFTPAWPAALRFYYRYGPHLLGLILFVLSSLIVFSLNRVAIQFKLEEASRRRQFHSEAKVREASEFLLRINRITRQVLSEIEYGDLMRKMAELLIEECACESITVVARPLGNPEPEDIDVVSEGLYPLAHLDPGRLFSPEVDLIFGGSSLITSEHSEAGALAPLLFGPSAGAAGWLALRLASRSGQTIGYIIMIGRARLDPSMESASLLRHLTSQLSSALENASLYKQAKSASEAKTSFMANMSHEIRTPLNAIIGFSEMMLHEQVDATQRQSAVRTVRQAGGQLTRLIDDILDISKVEAGQMSIEREWINIRGLLRDVRSVFEPRIRDKGIELIFEIDSSVPAYVYCDDVRLKQILTNLLGNAAKFTHKGSVSLRVHVHEGLVFEIADTGIGIPSHFREHIFEPFSQGDTSSTRAYGGSGLGLALAKRLATLLGGQLNLVGSEVDKGTRFSLILNPVEMRGETSDTDVSGAKQSHHDLTSLSGKKILLVEDSEDNQEIFSFFLQKAGATVEIVDNGKAAVEKASERKYDVILMDIQIPVLDGKTATRRLRDLRYDGPIVALTAHALTGQRKDILQAGCDGHIAKPVSGQALIEEVAKYMEAGV